MRITRRVEFDAGHRVPSHDGKCRSPHGHRYVVEATVRGAVVRDPERPDDGMVVDFGVLTDMLNRLVVDAYDHSFIVAADDPLRIILAEPPGGEAPWKVCVMRDAPTAENIALDIARRLNAAGLIGGELVAVEVWETPNCKATWGL